MLKNGESSFLFNNNDYWLYLKKRSGDLICSKRKKKTHSKAIALSVNFMTLETAGHESNNASKAGGVMPAFFAIGRS